VSGLCMGTKRGVMYFDDEMFCEPRVGQHVPFNKVHDIQRVI
jgi:hypothetical protein